MKKLFLLFAILLAATTAHAQMEKGYRGFFEIGHNFATESYDDYDYSAKVNNIISLSTTHGYQFNSWFFLGGGAEIAFWRASVEDGYYSVHNTETVFGGFVNLRFDLPSVSRITYFGTVKAGVSYYDGASTTGFCVTPAIGARYQVHQAIALNLSLNYTLCSLIPESDISRGLGIAIGVEF